MSRQVLRVVCYRLLVTARRRLPGYLGLAVVIGLTGGVAMGSAAAARRTASSFPVFLASTNPSDLTVQYAASGTGVSPRPPERYGGCRACGTPNRQGGADR